MLRYKTAPACRTGSVHLRDTLTTLQKTLSGRGSASGHLKLWTTQPGLVKSAPHTARIPAMVNPLIKESLLELHKKFAKELTEAAARQDNGEIPASRPSNFLARMHAKEIDDKLAQHGPGFTTGSIKLKDELQFRSLLDALAQDVVDAHIYWNMWKSLTELLPQWVDVQVEASTFWHYTRSAHLRTALASLSRAFDQEQRSLHLKNWLVAIGEHRHLFTVEPSHAGFPTIPLQNGYWKT